MNVSLISDNLTKGGAAIAATRLADGLLDIGFCVDRVVANRDGRWGGGTVRVPDLRLDHSKSARVRRRFSGSAARDRELHAARLAGIKRVIREADPEIINVHNLHGTLHKMNGWPFDVLDVLKDWPVVWTLHDMWSFTGRCAYAYNCERFVHGCNASCPTPDEYPTLTPEKIRDAWTFKTGWLDERPDAVAISPSHWLAREAERGAWAGHRVEVIPYGFPLEVYRPVDQASARQVLDMPKNQPVLLGVAQSITDQRKGFGLLVDALKLISERGRITLLLLGQGQFETDIAHVDVITTGYVQDEALKRIIYSAADALVHPALGDNLPNVVIEAMACGTPTIAFDLGGLPDMVRPGKTGWLVPKTTSEALASGIDEAMKNGFGGTQYRETCRAIAENEYSLNLQAERYSKLFEEVISEFHGKQESV